MPEAVAVALDVGGTKVAAGLVSAGGDVLHEQRDRYPLQDRRTGGPGLELTLAAASAMLALAAERGLDVVGIGAGFPEYVDADGGLGSRDVLQWQAQPLVELGRIAPGLPCTVDSDVRLAALAEARCGAGAGLESFLYVTLGTGISSTFVLRGEPWAGARGEAIALGELAVPGPVDAGWPGTLEQYASGSGIARRYAQRSGAQVDGADQVLQLAGRGDAAAAEILGAAGTAIGLVLGDLVCVLDPAAVILGGGLGSAGGAVERALRAAFAARLSARPGAPPLHVAKLGPRAGLVGAGLVVHERRAAAQRAPTSRVARKR